MDTTAHDLPAVASDSPAAQVSPEILEQVAIAGDLSGLTAAQRLAYYRALCQSLGLNPLSKPFEYLTLNGKLRLYALRDCADQLRRLHGISIYITNRERLQDIYIVTARAKDRQGREDESTGAVALGTLKGDALANALMKCETKAKRRVTLSIAGLGWLDETELETIPGARTGETATPAPPADQESQVLPETARITKGQAKDLRDVAKLAFGERFAARLRQDLGLTADDSLTLTRLVELVPVDQYQTLIDGYEACPQRRPRIDNIVLLAYWPDRVDIWGGRRRELPRLLRRDCRGATRVVVYKVRETIWEVRHVACALERWQRAGGHV